MAYDTNNLELVLQNNNNSARVGYFLFDGSGHGVSSTGNPLFNSQCTVYSASRAIAGDVLSFTLDIGFSSSFKAAVLQGRVIFYGGIQDSTPANSDWAPVAGWWLNF